MSTDTFSADSKPVFGLKGSCVSWIDIDVRRPNELLKMSYQFLSKQGIVALHQQQISEHRGSVGIREAGLLESTLLKAQTLLNYVPESNVWDLAAAYGYDFIQNHVFIDGNKRVGLAAMAAFLYLNGYEMTSTEAEEVSVVLSVATGALSQEDLAHWLQRSTVQL